MLTPPKRETPVFTLDTLGVCVGDTVRITESKRYAGQEATVIGTTTRKRLTLRLSNGTTDSFAVSKLEIIKKATNLAMFGI